MSVHSLTRKSSSTHLCFLLTLHPLISPVTSSKPCLLWLPERPIRHPLCPPDCLSILCMCPSIYSVFPSLTLLLLTFNPSMTQGNLSLSAIPWELQQAIVRPPRYSTLNRWLSGIFSQSEAKVLMFYHLCETSRKRHLRKFCLVCSEAGFNEVADDFSTWVVHLSY